MRISYHVIDSILSIQNQQTMMLIIFSRFPVDSSEKEKPDIRPSHFFENSNIKSIGVKEVCSEMEKANGLKQIRELSWPEKCTDVTLKPYFARKTISRHFTCEF